jgi:hypothetical protein
VDSVLQLQGKVSPNPVVDFLRQKPWEHRVVSRTSPMGPYDLGGNGSQFRRPCHWWLENDYPFNDIESLEIDQAPRMPVLDSSYLGNFLVRSRTDLSPATRLWQLTNTRYISATRIGAGAQPVWGAEEQLSARSCAWTWAQTRTTPG